MKVVGKIPGNGRSFEKMLEAIQSNANWYLKLLKTISSTKYFTNNVLVTKLTEEDAKLIAPIARKHAKTLSNVVQLDFSTVLPKKLGSRVKSAEFAGKGKTYYLVLLRGEGREALVEMRSFLTLLERHPDAEWYFARGRNYWKKPILLLDNDGFFKGTMLGALVPVFVKDQVVSSSNPPLSYDNMKCLEVKGTTFKYVPYEVSEDDG